jgi:hypothetical protein
LQVLDERFQVLFHRVPPGDFALCEEF